MIKSWKKAHPEKTAYYNAQWRTRRAVTTIEPINPEAIAQRDGFRCHLCRGKVTPETASLDHLIPLSKGGTHTISNVALAHRRCNSGRGAGRKPAQLLLIADVPLRVILGQKGGVHKVSVPSVVADNRTGRDDRLEMTAVPAY